MATQSLNLVCPGEMTSPDPDTPSLPDIESGLLAHFDENSLAGEAGARSLWPITSGQAIYSLVSTAVPETNRPTLSLDGGRHGGKALMFNPADSARLQNAVGSINQGFPFTAAFRVKSNAKDVTQTLFSSDSSTNYLSARVTNTNNRYTMLSPGGDVFYGPAVTEEWVTAVFAFDGVNSFCVIEDREPFYGALGVANPAASRLSTFRVGASVSLANFFSGYIDRIRIYNRALLLVDAQALVQEWK